MALWYAGILAASGISMLQVLTGRWECAFCAVGYPLLGVSWRRLDRHLMYERRFGAPWPDPEPAEWFVLAIWALAVIFADVTIGL